ncbi:uncharacterized protein ALTATR162_LOCUS8112 [Alternaria atra]|uniref:Nitronate monooxygenase domain-containing protein n=1 Tax=Alternaria atra TaxID=119953 RepID=A0A8J2IFS0_9PLEO|nr:uncharacterized protein ALTATR162_LOCUS8112 [Alternaria atra]CAG5175470.1 unnamed protein product [Alternaria atra]
MAVEVSKAGGIGFIGAGTDVSDLASHIGHAKELLKSTTLQKQNGILPIGIGFINWGANLEMAIPIIAQHRPAAVWFFAPSSTASLVQWAEKSRAASPETKIWVQVGSVQEAVEAVKQVQPDVLVVQGTDAGGHGLVKGASIVTLLPEVNDTIDACLQKEDHTRQKPVLLAAGGISDSRTFAAALTLGASGCILGTRLLATPEANITQGYRSAVLRTTDGGQSTVRTKVYDSLRGTNWAETHNARGIITQSYVDAVDKGMSQEENTRLYKEEMGKGDEGWREHGGE